MEKKKPLGPAHPPIPPMTVMLDRETDWKKTIWFHGTRSSHLVNVAREGLVPRSEQKSAGNWDEHPSAPEMVYLTSCYGVHYARACAAPGLPCVLELDLASLKPDNFFADEDSYALSRVQGMSQLDGLSVRERVEFWRNNLELTDPNVGLRVLGNATYRGRVPPAAISKVRLLTEKESVAITLRISDPVISPQNFKLLGGTAQRLHKWLLGHETELNEYFTSLCPLSIPLMSLEEAVQYVARG